MVEEGRRSHFSNHLPCPQSGFRDFRGSKCRAVYWRREYPWGFQTLEFRTIFPIFASLAEHRKLYQNRRTRIKRDDSFVAYG